jgi:hypothetical protein
MTGSANRKPLKQIPSVSVRLRYLVYPYANFHLGQESAFNIGPFEVWRDQEESWQRFLKIPRPAKHLQMYVDRHGQPLQTVWIATPADGIAVQSEHWQHLTAVLFYLAWARIPYSSVDRPAAEDFYYEAFSLPDLADPDSSGHTRWSKYANTYWSDLKIHPMPEVSSHGTALVLPRMKSGIPGFDFEKDLRHLFVALDSELRKSESRLLTSLWFLQEASFRSASRSSFAEDIQNICTAFEALLNIEKKGDSAQQVADALVELFRDQAPTAADDLASKLPDPEHADVLAQLVEWVGKLYEIRNEYTHGKAVSDFFLNGRSVWQDAFEIFRLAANRVILQRPEDRPLEGSLIERRLMSVQYFDEVVALLWDREKWLPGGKELGHGPTTLDEAIRKGNALDPELVESITSLTHLRQALFNICMAIWGALEQHDKSESDGRSVKSFLEEFRAAYAACSNPKIKPDAFIRRIAPRVSMWVPTIPVAGSNALLYELIRVFNKLLVVYGNATEPILNSLSVTLPQRPV